MKLEYTVNSTKYTTVKEVLKAHFHISDRLILKLKRHNQIFINQTPAFMHTSLHLNDIVTANISFTETSENIVATNLPLEIIFEDESMLVLNKPAGIAVHPSISHFSDSLSNGVQYYFKKNNIHTKIRPVNRLDKDTSGLVIFAKNEYVQECLIRQMASHDFKKHYLALLVGNLDENHKIGTIQASIARKDNSIIEREINQNGQFAITNYKLIENYLDYCFVDVQLETGRTHQIRVHSKFIGHPILGDSLYGSVTQLIERQALHAYKICFVHPVTNQKIELKTQIPQDMEHLILSKTF